MSLVYYYAPMSSAERTTWAIEELGVDVERKLVDWRVKKETRLPEFLKLNPNGKVPLLVVDGHRIFESIAILVYLGETYGVDKGLYPPPGVERAECLKWIAWATASLFETLSRYLANTSPLIAEDLRNAKAGAKAHADVDAMLKLLDDELAGRTYLVGDRFTLADLAVAGYVPYLQFIGYDFSSYSNIVAWAGRCTARPAVQRVRQNWGAAPGAATHG